MYVLIFAVALGLPSVGKSMFHGLEMIRQIYFFFAFWLRIVTVEIAELFFIVSCRDEIVVGRVWLGYWRLLE